ncbi:regulatory signaling modulator protein AmpE [Porticoccus sp. W117]|uniref:regulatory signaling modulator protein AmpE n=1 Tax=Porticoccus sp. W117 TaxID=3054777 RepID=UPI0025974329|nr:regulatory signaling modulator protein AmpE [Porticoccus sp. W117]MDM3871061.1 regulatory signaling modulator protein AmpE [Porticoccus sp. W117]
MEFLIILVALGLHRLIPDLRLLHQDGWFFSWIKQLGEGPLTLPKFIVSLLLPTALMWLLGYLVAQWLGMLGTTVFGLLVLLYCLGRGNLPASLQTIEGHVEQEDRQAVFHDAMELEGEELVLESVDGETTPVRDSDEELHQALLQNLSYRFFEHSFPVVFWFFLLGVPGAILYRLSELQANRKQSRDQADEKCDDSDGINCPSLNLAQRWLWLMEWVPVRILGFTFALVGNFGCCMHHWKECVVCPIRTTGQVLLHYVVGALSADVDRADIQVAELEAVHNLFHRAMVLWLCLIAFLVVL